MLTRREGDELITILLDNGFTEKPLPGGFRVFIKNNLTVHEPIIGNWSITIHGEHNSVNKVINTIEEFTQTYLK